MSRAGDVLENPVAGEWAVVRLGTEDSGDGSIVVELVLKPGGAVAGKHVHPVIEKWFTVVSWRVAFRLDGEEPIARVGARMRVPVGMAHDWWNAGDEEARLVVEVSPAERFEAMISNLFGLARDGKTDAKGMPNLFQAAVFAREFLGRPLSHEAASKRPENPVRCPRADCPSSRVPGKLCQIHRARAGRPDRGRGVDGRRSRRGWSSPSRFWEP